MKSKKVIAALCALAVVVSSSGGLPLGGARLFETALTANADVTDVFKAVSDPDAIYGPTKIINGDFESGMNNNNRNGNYQGVNSGWGTTDNAFEISSSISTYGLKNATGYFAEMNANNAATLYQDLTTTGGDIMVWKLDHAARRSQENGIPNSNSMAVMIGASDGNYPSGTNSNINVHISSDTLATFEAGGVTNPEGRTLGYFASEEDSKYLTIDSKDSNNEWYSARGVYIIPDGQTTTRFAFVSTIADYKLRGWGNMLDNITFATLLGNASATQLASGDVELTGYWGDSDASKTLKIKIGDTEYSADMTDVLNNNFKIVIPLAALGGADTVTLYHVDYPEAGRTIPVTPARHVTYDGNGNTGGTVPTDEKDYPSSTSAIVFGNTGNLEKTGLVFAGWNTEADGSGTQYAPGNTFTIDRDITLYAQWTEAVATVTSGDTVTGFATLAEAVANWTDEGSTLTILKDLTTASTINVSGTMTFDLNGHGLRMTGNGSVINVGNGADLTIKDSSPDTTHYYTIADSVAMVDDSGEQTNSFKGGYITGGNAANGGGIYCTGKLTVDGGNLIGNRATGTGGGILLAGNGTFTLNDGGIIGNKALNGGGIGTNSASTINMTGGIIEKNVATTYTAGVLLDGGTTMNLSGGSIVNNVGKAFGGIGIANNNTKLKVSGSPVIKDNELTDGTTSNVKVVSTTMVTIADKLEDGAKIGITWAENKAFTVDYSKYNSERPSKYFFSDDANYSVVKTSNETPFEAMLGVAPAPVYTVTIPADVNIADDGTANADVSAEYDIGESTLSVTVASENGYKMKADYNSSILIPYKVTYGGKDLSDALEVLSVTGEGSSSETLYFSVDPEDMYAGKYSDVLTFNISLS